MIAFTSNRINNLDQVFLLNTSCLSGEPSACWTVKPTNLSAGFAVESFPAWSPDGNQIAVSSSINGAPGRIYIHNPRPGEPGIFDRTNHIIGAQNLDWAPDNTGILFAWIQPTINEIWLARLFRPGASPLKLTNSLGNKEPAYSYDGQWIAFTSTRDQNPEIYTMTTNGSNQTNISNSPGSRDIEPDWQPPASTLKRHRFKNVAQAGQLRAWCAVCTSSYGASTGNIKGDFFGRGLIPNPVERMHDQRIRAPKEVGRQEKLNGGAVKEATFSPSISKATRAYGARPRPRFR